jgi:hypothetical protein
MYTPEELCNSHQNQATFNFNNLPSHENYFACLCSSDFLLAGCQSKSKLHSQQTQQITSENKVTNNNSTKSNQRWATILSKKETILCYHNIKDFDAECWLMTKVYIKQQIAAQMKALSEAGYHIFYPHNCTTIYYMTAKTNHFDDTVENNIQ